MALAAIIAGLVAVNVALYDTPVDIAPIASAKGRDGGMTSAPGGSLEIPDLGDFSETFERPLFSPTRRKFVPEPIEPQPVEVAAVAVEQPAPPQNAAPAVAPSLLGISIHGGAAKALLRIAGADNAFWYGNGETVDGWTVSTIDKNQAVLERNGKVARISLYPASQDAASIGSVGQ
ncbi:hypothetical protein NMG46_06950 [Mesorhizobium sp. LMG 17147]|uniref:hypothetical protein n=1 Tax=Mesorhizobium sp. LMG 17147 TaxID=2963091 RepID=UPI0020C9620F|nr:hypothetical protein [Mesorhizobium sp. LMG 17147]MCP9229983.1 hypothetical protein [Mesorhizobium sp. LMG 17147]